MEEPDAVPRPDLDAHRVLQHVVARLDAQTRQRGAGDRHVVDLGVIDGAPLGLREQLIGVGVEPLQSLWRRHQRGQQLTLAFDQRVLPPANVHQGMAIVEQDTLEGGHSDDSSKPWRTTSRLAAAASSSRVTGRVCGALLRI